MVDKVLVTVGAEGASVVEGKVAIGGDMLEKAQVSNQVSVGDYQGGEHDSFDAGIILIKFNRIISAKATNRPPGQQRSTMLGL